MKFERLEAPHTCCMCGAKAELELDKKLMDDLDGGKNNG